MHFTLQISKSLLLIFPGYDQEKVSLIIFIKFRCSKIKQNMQYFDIFFDAIHIFQSNIYRYNY